MERYSQNAPNAIIHNPIIQKILLNIDSLDDTAIAIVNDINVKPPKINIIIPNILSPQQYKSRSRLKESIIFARNQLPARTT